MRCATVKIKSSHPPSQGEFVEINESDFNAEVHDLFVPPPPTMAAPSTLPPPPMKRGPDLPANWRAMKPGELRALAERLTGRTADNRDQAVAMIESAIT